MCGVTLALEDVRLQLGRFLELTIRPRKFATPSTLLRVADCAVLGYGLDVEELYERYSRSVFRRARRLLGDDEAAKDATQEVFLRILRMNPLPALEPNPMAWLYRTTTNLCLNRLRDTKRRGELLTSFQSHSAADCNESRVIVQGILDQVPEALQEVAIYYYVDELSHDEISSIIGVSRRTVGNRLVSFHEFVGALLRKGVA